VAGSDDEWCTGRVEVADGSSVLLRLGTASAWRASCAGKPTHRCAATVISARATGVCVPDWAPPKQLRRCPLPGIYHLPLVHQGSGMGRSQSRTLRAKPPNPCSDLAQAGWRGFRLVPSPIHKHENPALLTIHRVRFSALCSHGNWASSAAIAETVVSRGSALGGVGGGGGSRARRARWLRPKILPPRAPMRRSCSGILLNRTYGWRVIVFPSQHRA
jgi:hypothetical protein